MWAAMPGSADWLTLPHHSPVDPLLALLQGVLCCEQLWVAVGATSPIRVWEEGCGGLLVGTSWAWMQQGGKNREGRDHG